MTGDEQEGEGMGEPMKEHNQEVKKIFTMK